MVTIEELQVILGCDSSTAEQVLAGFEKYIDRFVASVSQKVQQAAEKTARAAKRVKKAKDSIGSSDTTTGGSAFKGIETSLSTVSRKLDGVQSKARRTFKTLQKMTHMSTQRGDSVYFTKAANEKAATPHRWGVDDGRPNSLATVAKQNGGPQGPPNGINSPATAQAIEAAVIKISAAYERAALKAGEFREKVDEAADAVAETASTAQSSANWGYDKGAVEFIENASGGSGGVASDKFGPLTKEGILQDKIDFAQRNLDALYEKYNQVVARMGAESPAALSIEKKIMAARQQLLKLDEDWNKLNATASAGVGGGAGASASSSAGAAATGAAAAGATGADTSGYSALRDRIIELEAEVERLRAQLGNLDGQAGRTGNALTRSFGRVRSALSSVGGGLKRVIGLFGRFKKTTGKSNGILGKFGATLKRVAVRMVAMKIIRGIINGFTQGFEILKEKSESCNTAFTQLTAASNVIKASLGAAVMPIVKALVPLFNQLAIAVANCANMIARFFASLTGQATYTAVSVGNALGSASDSASGAGKEAKNSLADFDEINLIQKSGGGSGAGGATALMADIKDVATGYSALADAMKGGDWELVGTIIGQKITGALNKAYTFLKSYDWDGMGRSAADLLNGAFAATDFTLAGQTLGASLNALVDTAFGFADQFEWDQLGQKVSDAVNGFFKETDWAKLGQTINAWALGLLSSIKTFLLETDWMEIGRSLGEAITNVDWLQIMADVIVIVVEALFAAVAGIWGLLKEIGTSIVDGVKDGLTWDDVGKWLKEKILDPIVEAFKKIFKIGSPSKVMEELAGFIMDGLRLGLENGLAAVVKFFTDLWTDIKTSASAAWQGVKNAWNTASSWFNNTIIVPIKTFFSNLWLNLKTGASTAWENVKRPFVSAYTWASGVVSGIKQAFNVIPEWFRTTFSNAWQKVKDVFSSGGQVFDGIKDGILSGLKTVINAIIRGINKVVAVPFNGLNSALRKIRGISIAGLKPFSGLSTVSVPQIPTLASGGIAFGDTLAQVGEYSGAKANPEVIAPLSGLKAMLSDTGAVKEQIAYMKQQIALLTAQNGILKQIAAKELVVSPSVGLGQVVSRSIDLYDKV